MESSGNAMTLDTAVPACYIERGDVVPGLNKILITQWLNEINLEATGMPRHYNDYIRYELTNAENNHSLWSTVQRSKHIWIASTFELTESAKLFIKVAEEASEKGVTDKLVFNYVERRSAIHYLAKVRNDIGSFLAELEISRRIKLYFLEDLYESMGRTWNG